MKALLHKTYFKLPIIIGGFFFICLFTLNACKKADNLQDITGNLPDSLNIETITDVNIRYTDSGQLKARIIAPLMYNHPQAEEPYTEMPNGIEAFFYKDGKTVVSTLNAGRAYSYTESKKIIAKDKVEVTNIKDETLETEKLTWDQKTAKVYTDEFVKIRRKNDILFGHGFESNEQFTKYKIKKLTGRIAIKDSDSTNNLNTNTNEN